MTFGIQETGRAVTEILQHTGAIATLNSINEAARVRDAKIAEAFNRAEEVRRSAQLEFMHAVVYIMDQYNTNGFIDDDDDDMDDDD